MFQVTDPPFTLTNWILLVLGYGSRFYYLVQVLMVLGSLVSHYMERGSMVIGTWFLMLVTWF
ncbi:hypothetical protein ABTQ33_11590 [Paucilactobacillus suebicus]|uniref:hypothetical protein n=1 Tax=Paucilactobacillus suebicus TaxID=152335 RepID=UPI0013895745|nr:hypothetical protein [Paucilactobacillus suebicus]